MQATIDLTLSPAEELDALMRRHQLYAKLLPYAPAGIHAVVAAVRSRGQSLKLAARIEATASRRFARL
jgi:hypothetical protein